MNTSTQAKYEGLPSLRPADQRTKRGKGEAPSTRAGTQVLPVADKDSFHPELLEALTSDLASLLDLHLRYKVHEWTVGGPYWYVYRSLFVDLGRGVAKSIDLVADRIVGLGGATLPDLGYQANLSYLAQGSTVPETPARMLNDNLKAERTLSAALARSEVLARERNDYLSEDLLRHLRAKHQRHISELSSQCEAASIGGLR